MLQRKACFVPGPFQSLQEQLLQERLYAQTGLRFSSVIPSYEVSKETQQDFSCMWYSHVKCAFTLRKDLGMLTFKNKCHYTSTNVPPPYFFEPFIHRFSKDFSDCEKNNFSFLQHWISHLILITLFFLTLPAHDNVLAVSIETRSASSSTNFYSLFSYLYAIQRQIH